MKFNNIYLNIENINKYKKEIFFKGNTIVHYAVLNNNLKSIKNMLKLNFNFNLQNNNGDTPLHLAIRYQHSKIINILLNIKNININIINNNHIDIFYEAILINNNTIINNIIKLHDKDIKYNLFKGPNGKNYFHEAIIKNNKELINIFLKKYYNLNIKDLNGNNLLHYSAIYNNIDLIKLLKKKYVNFNESNFFKENPLNYYIKRDSKIDIIKNLINNNINSHDLNGNNCLINYLLFHNNIDNKLIKIFIDNNINLYHYNNDELSVLVILMLNNKINNFNYTIKHIKNIDYVTNKSNPLLIVYLQKTNTININFLIILLKIGYDINIPNIYMDTSVHYLSKLENINKEHIDLILKYNGNFFIENRKKKIPLNNINNNKIKEYIIKKYFKNDNCINNLNSCIKKNKIIQDEVNILQKQKKIKTNFEGTGINEFFGLLYLLKKYKSDCSPISDNISNLDFNTYGLDYKININKIYFPKEYKNNFLKCKKNKKIKFIITPLRLLNNEEGSHSNYLIYNKYLNELERFDPYGNLYNNNNIDIKIEEFYKNIDSKIKYLLPIENCPYVGLQVLQELELELQLVSSSIGDPIGFCSAWSIWYADMRLGNPKINRMELLKKATSTLKKKEGSLTNFIRNYAEFIVNERDKMLRTINIKYLYENKINKLKLNKIYSYINKEIKKLILRYTS